MDVFLQTERMILRRFTSSDVDLVLALDSDPAVRTYVEDGEPVDRFTVGRMIDHWMGWYERSPILGFWAAVDRDTGRFLGWFHFRPDHDDPPEEPELGYRLVSSAWGRGYATEGSRALIDLGFGSGQVSRVVAYTMTVHEASRRVMEKAGLRYVRTFTAQWPVHLPGDEHGDVEYAITLGQWREDRATGSLAP